MLPTTKTAIAAILAADNTLDAAQRSAMLAAAEAASKGA